MNDNGQLLAVGTVFLAVGLFLFGMIHTAAVLLLVVGCVFLIGGLYQ